MLEESLYYTTVSRLRAVWPTRFKTETDALPFLRNPEKLANAVYAGRLGNTKSTDGWQFRGSGLIQTTGRSNFEKLANATGIDCINDPALIRSMPGALQAAAVYLR